MFQVVTGLPEDIGDSMITDRHIDLITFTGGVPVGKMIAEKAGYRRTVLELGGNAPLIVMEDADLDKAASLAVAGATKNSGQRCTAVKRILVVDKVADAFAKLVTEKAKKFQPTKIKNSIAASDAFFPFADAIKILIKAGVKTIIQPGGSIRDQEVINAADKAKIKMIFTGIRHFNH